MDDRKDCLGLARIASFCSIEPEGASLKRPVALADAARRELAEEAGFVAQDWRLIARFAADAGRQTNHVHVFLAMGAAPGAARQLDAGEEGMTVETLPLAKLLAGLNAGVLPNCAHVAALMAALLASGRLGPQAAPERA